MTKAVFTTKVDPTYDDLPEERYQFPRTYLRQAEAAIGDWIVYYEPRRTSGDLSSCGGRQAYFATAKVDRIEPDPSRADRFYAFVSDYLEFERPVSFKESERYLEGALSRADGKTNKGAFGRAVRFIPDADYDLILQAGFCPHNRRDFKRRPRRRRSFRLRGRPAVIRPPYCRTNEQASVSRSSLCGGGQGGLCEHLCHDRL